MLRYARVQVGLSPTLNLSPHNCGQIYSPPPSLDKFPGGVRDIQNGQKFKVTGAVGATRERRGEAGPLSSLRRRRWPRQPLSVPREIGDPYVGLAGGQDGYILGGAGWVPSPHPEEKKAVNKKKYMDKKIFEKRIDPNPSPNIFGEKTNTKKDIRRPVKTGDKKKISNLAKKPIPLR